MRADRSCISEPAARRIHTPPGYGPTIGGRPVAYALGVSNIGVLREGPLHAAVKGMLARPGDRLEVPVGRFVIDLVRADGELVEIQTGGFAPVGAKLDGPPGEHRMRVGHPDAAQ